MATTPQNMNGRREFLEKTMIDSIQLYTALEDLKKSIENSFKRDPENLEIIKFKGLLNIFDELINASKKVSNNAEKILNIPQGNLGQQMPGFLRSLRFRNKVFSKYVDIYGALTDPFDKIKDNLVEVGINQDSLKLPIDHQAKILKNLSELEKDVSDPYTQRRIFKPRDILEEIKKLREAIESHVFLKKVVSDEVDFHITLARFKNKLIKELKSSIDPDIIEFKDLLKENFENFIDASKKIAKRADELDRKTGDLNLFLADFSKRNEGLVEYQDSYEKLVNIFNKIKDKPEIVAAQKALFVGPPKSDAQILSYLKLPLQHQEKTKQPKSHDEKEKVDPVEPVEPVTLMAPTKVNEELAATLSKVTGTLEERDQNEQNTNERLDNLSSKTTALTFTTHKENPPPLPKMPAPSITRSPTKPKGH